MEFQVVIVGNFPILLHWSFFFNQDPSKCCILHLVGHFDNKKVRKKDV